jgi:hypothetical protein
VHIQNSSAWCAFSSGGCSGSNPPTVQPASCTSGGNMTSSTGDGTGTDLLNLYTGGSSQVVLVTVCYKWDAASLFPWIRLGGLSGGSGLIQAASAFRSEPYN